MTWRCLSTRATPEGFKRRRYEDERGERRTTIEVPLELWHRMADRDERGQGRAQRVMNRLLTRDEVREMWLQNIKPLAVESATNVPLRTVQRWYKAFREGKKITTNGPMPGRRKEKP